MACHEGRAHAGDSGHPRALLAKRHRTVFAPATRSHEGDGRNLRVKRSARSLQQPPRQRWKKRAGKRASPPTRRCATANPVFEAPAFWCPSSWITSRRPHGGGDRRGVPGPYAGRRARCARLRLGAGARRRTDASAQREPCMKEARRKLGTLAATPARKARARRGKRVRRRTVRRFRPRSVAGCTGGRAALGDAFVFVRNRQDVQTYQNPLQNAVCGE